MKKMPLVFIAAIIFAAALLQPFVAFAQTGSNVYMTGKPSQAYYPGDVVHVVVEAPVDTDSVTAVMPDGQELNMVYDRRNKVWHNYWQVPMYFKKGTYVAKLTATDVEGKNFEGETSSIIVAEPTMPVIMRFVSSEEAAQKPAAVQPAPPAPAVAPAPAKPAPAAIKPAPAPVKPAPVAAKPAPVPAKPARVVPKAPVQRSKTKTSISVTPKLDINIIRLRYIVAARNYVAKQDYVNARTRLNALLKIDPENSEIKQMLTRIETVIKTRQLI